MKRTVLGVVLAVIMLLSLTACNKLNLSTSSSEATPTKTTVSAGASQTPAKSTSSTPAPANSGKTADKLVTIADVEKVSGLTGIKTVPRDPSKGAGGDLNFATQDDKLVLMVLVSGSSLYKTSKEQKGYFHAEVSGIGDEAFDGPADDQNPFKAPDGTKEPFVLAFRKGTSMVTVSSFLDMTKGKAYVSQDKLRELAKIVVPRM